MNFLSLLSLQELRLKARIDINVASVRKEFVIEVGLTGIEIEVRLQELRSKMG